MMKNLISIYFSLFFGLAIFAQPANDDCANATQITDLDGTCNTYNNSGATLDAPPSNLVGGCFDNTNTSWFQFTAQGNTVDIDINSTVNKFNPDIVILGDLDGDICDGIDSYEVDCAAITNGNTSDISMSTYPIQEGETYWIVVASQQQGSYELCVDNPENVAGAECSSSEAFCTEDPATFPAQTNTTAPSGNAYGCLNQQPNPAWFYLEIGTNGSIDLELSNSNNVDIDYIIWGPLTDISTGCDTEIQDPNTIEDCSYLIDATEYGTIDNAVAGETYILMVTNFSNAPTDITIEQVGGTGTTDCTIVLPVNLLDFGVSKYKNANEIWWSTASEEHNDYFILEHSTDGENWTELDKVKGAGNSTSQNDYYTLHREYENSINYYRLKQVDFDGTISDHGIVSIDNRTDVKLVKRVNALGQEADKNYDGVVFEYYSDGSIRKIMQ